MNNKDKKTQYLKIDGDESVSSKKPRVKKKKQPLGKLTVPQKIGKCCAVVGTTLLCMVLVVIIAACIVATGLTIYVMQFAESDFDINLEDVELNYSSFVYAKNSDGENVVMKQLSADENRVWVDLTDLPQHTIDAFISAEDARFFEHDGVDWKRTVAVTVKALLSGGTEGGSTITQQLVRDITGDDDVNVGRKLREIFRALALEQKYTKQDILESYLNRIAFGGTSYGIASAALRYFDKDVSELTVAESAILAGIVRSPSNFNPYANLSKCRQYQLRALKNMYSYGYLTTQQYEDAVNEQVKFRLPVKGDDFGYVDERYNEYYGIADEEDDDLYYENVSWDEIGEDEKQEENDVPYKWNGSYEVTQDWYMDAAIYQVVEHLAQMKGITSEAARTLLYNGGFSIYMNVDLDLQTKISELFENPLTCVKESALDYTKDKDDCLQAAFVLMNYSGDVLAIAGGLGEKEGDNCFNRAFQAKQVIGSTIKPLAVYSVAIENNAIYYSTMIKDISGKINADTAGVDVNNPINGYDKEDNTVRWPHNYEESGFGSEKYVTAYYGLYKSMNTLAVNTLSRVGVVKAFEQLNKFGFELDATNDMAWSPLALGQLTNGIALTDLAAAYAIMGNGGLYYEPYFYSQVLDSDGKVVLSQNSVGTQLISSDTAWIVNRMMKGVVTDPVGSGRYAALDNIEVIGKTGTANDMSALLFCGLTPSYVGVYRTSFDDNHEVTKADGWITIPRVWGNVMREICDTSYTQNFIADPNVIETNYCTETGLIATSKCPSTAIGYYRPSNIPQSCDSKHDGTYWETHEDPDYIPFYK